MNNEEVAKRHWMWATNALEAADRDIGARDPTHAVSRSYYAMFHAANAALATKGLQPKTHNGTQKLFNEKLVLTGQVTREHGRELGKGQQRRTSAEYNVYEDVPQSTGEEQCRRARQFLQEVRGWLLRNAGLPGNEVSPVPPQSWKPTRPIPGHKNPAPPQPPSAAGAAQKAAASRTRGTGQER